MTSLSNAFKTRSRKLQCHPESGGTRGQTVRESELRLWRATVKLANRCS